METHVIYQFKRNDSTQERFIVVNLKKQIQQLFARVLFKCAELRLLTGEMFAIDSCKLPLNA